MSLTSEGRGEASHRLSSPRWWDGASLVFSVLPEPQQELVVRLQPVVQSPEESGAERGRGEYEPIHSAPGSMGASRPFVRAESRFFLEETAETRDGGPAERRPVEPSERKKNVTKKRNDAMKVPKLQTWCFTRCERCC